MKKYGDLTDNEKLNYRSHHYGVIDDCYRCIDCEVGSWNGWKELCFTANREV